jgi:hypothetical protein
MFTVIGELEFTMASGTTKLPVGLAGTATPPMLVTIREGWAVEAGMNRLKGFAR